MNVDLLIAEAASVTSRLANRTENPALHAVAASAEEAIGSERARPATECPLVDVEGLVPGGTHADTASLVEAFCASLGELAWFRNDAVPTDFATQSAGAELVGPDGAIASEALRFGFFLITPNAEYVRHWHAAVEHYMVLAGSALFDLDAGLERHGAGEVVAIPSMAPHAITTDEAGVLILYSWTGDISFDSYGY